MVRQLFESTNLGTLELSTDSIAISRGSRVILRPMIWGAVRPYLADIYVRELERHAEHEELNEEEENDGMYCYCLLKYAITRISFLNSRD
jgi:hypothetical protein